MLLVIVARQKVSTFDRFMRESAKEPGLRVIWDRRVGQRRRRAGGYAPERRVCDRRVDDALARHDHIVVHAESEDSRPLVI